MGNPETRFLESPENPTGFEQCFYKSFVDIFTAYGTFLWQDCVNQFTKWGSKNTTLYCLGTVPVIK